MKRGKNDENKTKFGECIYKRLTAIVGKEKESFSAVD